MSSIAKLMLQNKHVLDKQLSRSLCFNFVHCVRKNFFSTAAGNISEFECRLCML